MSDLDLRTLAKEAIEKIAKLSHAERRELKIAQYTSWVYGQVNLSRDVPVSRAFCEKAARDYLLVPCLGCGGEGTRRSFDMDLKCKKCDGYGKELRHEY